ncbi:MAG: hypothetical protein K5776_13245 [Lachnospiraceae bacterium]|nr:hypothetical protein [Lachnospiraceae bacterium]
MSEKTLENKKDNGYIYLAVSLVLGIIFLLFYSVTTSPLSYNFIGSDSAFFQAVGKLMHSGKLMYRDIYDQKGPLLYFIEYLGYCFPNGRYGVLFIQALFMSANIIALKKTVWVLELKNKAAVFMFSTFFFFLCLSLYFDCGNLTEEYSLPFIFISLFLHFKGMKEKKYARYVAYVYGIGFGLIALIRITNSVLIDVCMLHLFLMCLIKKDFKNAILHSLRFGIGAVAAMAPFFAYYAIKGSFYDFFNTVFIFAYKYATGNSFLTRVINSRWSALVPFILFCIIAIFFCRKNLEKTLFISLTLFFTLFVLFLGYSFVHYYQLIIIPMIAAMLLVFDENNKMFKPFCIILVFSIILISNRIDFVTRNGRMVSTIVLNTEKRANTKIGQILKQYIEINNYEFCGYQSKEAHEDILNHIPEEYRNSVYSYSGGPQWLLYSDTDPYCRYCETADSFANISPDVEKEIIDMFNTRPPKYLVSNHKEKVKNEKIINLIDSKYETIYSNEKLDLLVNKEFAQSFYSLDETLSD